MTVAAGIERQRKEADVYIQIIKPNQNKKQMSLYL